MKTNVLLLFAFIVLAPATTTAQKIENRFGLELNGGMSIPTNKMCGVTLNAGLGFEGLLNYRFSKHSGLYAGWGWNHFSAQESFEGNDVCFGETGYVFGFQYKHPFGNGSFDYYLRLGGLYNHIETENDNGDIINNTRHGLGWQVACGIEVPLRNSWSFNPGLKFNALTRESEFEGVTKKMTHNYVSLRVGIVKYF